MNGPVVVGVDGSDPSLAAVSLAVRLAAERGRALRVVHAFIWPLLHVPLGPDPSGPAEGGLENEAHRILAAAMDHARQQEPAVEVTGEVITGSAAPVLLTESRDAALLVVGDRGLGGFTSLLLGSVAVEVVAHASCPVTIARGHVREGDVLVGVDGSPVGKAALEFAVDEAARRGSELVALHAYTNPSAEFSGELIPPIIDERAASESEDRVLREAIAGFNDRYPDVTIRPLLVREPAARALVERSGTASMTVVGTRGLGGFRGLMLGSVSQALIHHSESPVTIVR